MTNPDTASILRETDAVVLECAQAARDAAICVALDAFDHCPLPPVRREGESMTDYLCRCGWFAESMRVWRDGEMLPAHGVLCQELGRGK
jgi:hypothetical protein